MAAFDLAGMLADVAKPRTRAQALADGHLFDVTRAAAWMGFQVAAAMTEAAWEETVGIQTARSTVKERAMAGERLRSVWQAAAKAVQVYKVRGAVLPAIRFTHPAASNPRRLVRLVLRAGVESGTPYVTVALEGES